MDNFGKHWEEKTGLVEKQVIFHSQIMTIIKILCKVGCTQSAPGILKAEIHCDDSLNFPEEFYFIMMQNDHLKMMKNTRTKCSIKMYIV